MPLLCPLFRIEIGHVDLFAGRELAQPIDEVILELLEVGGMSQLVQEVILVLVHGVGSHSYAALASDPFREHKVHLNLLLVGSESSLHLDELQLLKIGQLLKGLLDLIS